MRGLKCIALFMFALAGMIAFSGVVCAQASVRAETQVYKEAQFNVEYPKFQGIEDPLVQTKINQAIKADMDTFIASCKAEKFNREAFVNYKVYYVRQDKISFEIVMYTYNGGAHGSTVARGYTYDLKTGHRCALTELFDYRPSEINRMIFKQAKACDHFLFEDFKGLTRYPDNFYLNEAGKAVIVFQQYEIAPYSSGVIRIEME